MSLFNRRMHQGRQTLGQNQVNWLPLFVILALLLYWLFARSLERVDLRPLLEPWWQSWAPFWQMPAALVIAAEMLHPRVLRHLIAPLVGWYLAYRAAVNLVHVLYDLPDRVTARRFLGRLRMSTPPLIPPLAVNGQTLTQMRESWELLRVGGPGLIAITAGEVAVTEVNGRFHRILGSGVHLLGRFEYVHAILDLRPQERTATDVRLTTRDGIEVKADVTLIFRLDTGGEFPSRTQPYPFDEEAVRQAAYNQTVLPEGGVSTWDSAPIGAASGALAKIIANYRLDELLHARAAAEPYQAIRAELTHKIRPMLANQGIELAGLHISRLELPEEVANQYIDYWRTHWQTQIRLLQADGEAMALEEVEIARAEAEMTMIQAIVEGVQRAQQSADADNMREIVALRLVEALEKIARQSQQEIPLPITLLPQIDTIHRQLAAGGEETNALGATET